MIDYGALDAKINEYIKQSAYFAERQMYGWASDERKCAEDLAELRRELADQDREYAKLGDK